MTCREIEERILESEVQPSSDAAVVAHVDGCEVCRAFQQSQVSLDAMLAARYIAPAPSAGFDKVLAQRIEADRRRALWDYLPDLLHLGGGVAASAVCAWLLPAAAGRVLAIGVGITVAAYLLQMLVRGWIDQPDEG